jgi:type VI secretion system Hcp family effector
MIFLKLDGIPGDAGQPGREGWIVVTSMDWQGSRSFNTLVGAAGNREGSEPVIGNVVITKKLDKASPKLFGAFCAGAKGLAATIELTRTASGGEV